MRRWTTWFVTGEKIMEDKEFNKLFTYEKISEYLRFV